MPILKISVVNNLGIISHACRDDLTRKLFKKAEETEAFKHEKVGHRNPFEITEDFMKKFNNAEKHVGQERFVRLADQLLSRSKRRAGLKSFGEGNHVELPLAWAELMLLALCSGKIQNDSLDCLLESLNQAPVHAEQVPVLFYLGESVLCWVTTNTAQRPNPYSCEAKMLKVGYLVFLRLLLSHISGNLSGYQKSKSNLLNLLTGLAQYDSCYQSCPDVLFTMHFILHTGEFICGPRPRNNDTGQSSADRQGYEMSQVLWHCLLSWYCVRNNVRQLPQVLDHLDLLRDDLLKHSWVDCGLGLMVLGEAAKSNLLCLHILLDLPVNHRQDRDVTEPKREVMSQKRPWPWQLDHIYASMLADICQHGCIAEIRKAALVGKRTLTSSSGGLLSLLKCTHREDWRVRYSAVRALMSMCEGMRGDSLRDGLRNTAWLALHKHLANETDPWVTEAVRLTQSESNHQKSMCRDMGMKMPVSPPVGGAPNHPISWRLALTLSQLYLPPNPLPHPPYDKLTKLAPPHPIKTHQEGVTTSKKNKNKVPPPRAKNLHINQAPAHDSPREENVVSKTMLGMSIDSNTQRKSDLMKLVEDQWQKERKRRMADDEEAEKKDREIQQRVEEDHFREIMQKRMEKVKKSTKPYELPGCKRPNDV